MGEDPWERRGDGPRAPRPNGRPAFAPTEQQRHQVRCLASLRVAQGNIAKILLLSPTTLRKYFRAQLDAGAIEAKASVSWSLFDMATTKRNVSAAIFWAKTRSGFRTAARPPQPAAKTPPSAVTTDRQTGTSNRAKNPSAHPAKQGGF
jgi:hypothetical protein